MANDLNTRPRITPENPSDTAAPPVDVLTPVTMLRTSPDVLISAWWETGYLPGERILCIRRMQIDRPDKTFRLHPIEAVALVKVIKEGIDV